MNYVFTDKAQKDRNIRGKSGETATPTSDAQLKHWLDEGYVAEARSLNYVFTHKADRDHVGKHGEAAKPASDDQLAYWRQHAYVVIPGQAAPGQPDPSLAQQESKAVEAGKAGQSGKAQQLLKYVFTEKAEVQGIGKAGETAVATSDAQFNDWFTKGYIANAPAPEGAAPDHATVTGPSTDGMVRKGRLTP